MADRPRRRTAPMWVGTEADMAERDRRHSDEVWDMVRLAEADCERAHGGPLPTRLSQAIRSWLGRMVDVGRRLEREATMEARQRAERAERLVKRERERANGLARRLSEQRDPRRE